MEFFKSHIVTIVFFSIITAHTQENEIYVEHIHDSLLDNEYRFDLDNNIYKVGREFLFSCSTEVNGETVDSDLKFIKLTVEGTTFPFNRIDKDYSQTVIKYDYLDIKENVIMSERTGVIENDKNVWIHPPRSRDTDVLQLVAFPLYKYEDNESWQWKLEAAYGEYENVIMTNTYKKGNTLKYSCMDWSLNCIEVFASTSSYIGITKSKFLFNEIYGFVKMQFETVDNSVILLELINKPKI